MNNKMISGSGTESYKIVYEDFKTKLTVENSVINKFNTS